MLKYPMISMQMCEELVQRFGPVEDPEIEARRQHLLDQDAKTRQQLIDTGVLEGRLTATRISMRRVLARRQLTPNKDDSARIDACTDLPTLERWLDQAITAFSASDVLA